MNLGQFIEALCRQPSDNEIRFDFPRHNLPTNFASYRGFYDHLALGHRDFDPKVRNPTVADVLAEANRALGNTYVGWKGGNYRMTAHTPIWVDNPGHYSSIRIIGVTSSYVTIIHTMWRDD